MSAGLSMTFAKTGNVSMTEDHITAFVKPATLLTSLGLPA